MLQVEDKKTLQTIRLMKKTLQYLKVDQATYDGGPGQDLEADQAVQQGNKGQKQAVHAARLTGFRQVEGHPITQPYHFTTLCAANDPMQRLSMCLLSPDACRSASRIRMEAAPVSLAHFVLEAFLNLRG